MNRRKFLSLVVGATATTLIPGFSIFKKPKHPNLIFILADDLGFEDLSCYGSKKIKTPNLDKLAKSGMRFTQFYAASAVCTPTRVSCITGRYPLRFSVTKHFNSYTEPQKHLPCGTATVPKLLKQVGYATAHVGKWHLGGLWKDQVKNRSNDIPGPHEHGFDHYLCMYEDLDRLKMCNDKILYRQGCSNLVRNEKPVEPSGKNWTAYKVEESLDLIEKYHSQQKPFFLNLWFDAPHTPYEPAPEQYLKPYKSRAKNDDLLYRSMVTHLDAGVGKIITKLKKLGIEKNTLIIFTSDNGPSLQGSPGPYKGGKADLHEGGIREPMIAVWPGKIKAGSVTNELAHTNDILPTFCAAAGAKIPVEAKIDGRNILPLLLKGEPIKNRGTVFWQLDVYGWYPQPGKKPEPYASEIVRRGDWKLLAKDGKPVELFNIKEDPYERRNLLKVWPEIAEELAGELRNWLNEPRIPCE